MGPVEPSKLGKKIKKTSSGCYFSIRERHIEATLGRVTGTTVLFNYPKPYGRASFLDPVAEF